MIQAARVDSTRLKLIICRLARSGQCNTADPLTQLSWLEPLVVQYRGPLTDAYVYPD